MKLICIVPFPVLKCRSDFTVTVSADGKLYQWFAAYRQATGLVKEHEAMETPRARQDTGNNVVYTNQSPTMCC
jgi:hypothetical protein